MAATEDQDGRGPVTVYLTLDIESDYGRSDTYCVLDKAAPFFDWIKAERIPLTAFVVGKLLEQGHPIIDALIEQGVPVGVHGYTHSADTFGTMRTSHADEIHRGTDAYVKRIGRKPAGYRAAAGIVSREDVVLLDKLGFRYDASVFPMRRPHRYDFSDLPKTPFRWDTTKLVEIPLGLLTPSLPAGMTFINLLGGALSARLVAREARRLGGTPAWHVTDLHLHNLFACYPALGCLPFGLRLVYLAGAVTGGMSALRRLTAGLRRAGFAFGNLEAKALRLDVAGLPVVKLDCFDPPELGGDCDKNSPP
jgi:peptidoglycan/xylan/chitin deacetylase (PgdA/CDA1 family)